MDYEIIRSKRRTVSITVIDGRIILRAPEGLTDREAAKIIASHKKWIISKLELQAKTKSADKELSEEEALLMRKEAKRYFKDKTEYYARIMNLKYSRITITGAKTRFGSCSSKGNICFSYRLMQYPEAARDYVVVHELAHLVEMNHSSRFYSIIERYMPDYKERKKQLKNGG